MSYLDFDIFLYLYLYSSSFLCTPFFVKSTQLFYDQLSLVSIYTSEFFCNNISILLLEELVSFYFISQCFMDCPICFSRWAFQINFSLLKAFFHYSLLFEALALLETIHVNLWFIIHFENVSLLLTQIDVEIAVKCLIVNGLEAELSSLFFK